MSYRTKEQLRIIRNTSSSCEVEDVQNLELESSAKAVADGFQDPTILHTVLCWNNTLMLYPDNDKGLNASEKIRRHFYNMRIGEDDQDIYDMYPLIRSNDIEKINQLDTSRPFMIKTTKMPSPDDAAKLIHEYFVSVYGTNKLRNTIPNFIYALGLLNCSVPFVEKASANSDRMDVDSRDVLTFCESSNSRAQTPYIIYENISSLGSLADGIRAGIDLHYFMSLFIQTIMAVHEANTDFNYTNYNLTAENVLVRRLEEEVYISYEIGYLRTNVIAVIADNTNASFVYNDNTFGVEGTTNTDFPMYDVHSLIMSSLDVAKDYNPGLYNELSSLTEFFSEEPANVAIATAKKNNWRLEYSDENNSSLRKYYDDVIERRFRRITINLIQDMPPMDKTKIFGCNQKGTCLSREEILDTYFVKKEKFIRNPYIFVELQDEDSVNHNFYLFKEHMRILVGDFLALSGRYLTIREEEVNYSPDRKGEYLESLNKFARAFDLMRTMFDVARIYVLFLEKYPRMADTMVENTNYTYNNVPTIFFYNTLANSEKLNSFLTNLERIPENVRTAMDEDVKEAIVEFINAVDYFPGRI